MRNRLPFIDDTRFATYFHAEGKTHENITLRELLKIPDLVARAENSGCEACYVEVARWNFNTSRWEKFAFEKYFGGEGWKDANDRTVCTRVAAIINHVSVVGRQWASKRTQVLGVKQVEFASIIHSMPSWQPS